MKPRSWIERTAVMDILSAPNPRTERIEAVIECFTKSIKNGYPRKSVMHLTNKLFVDRIIGADEHGLITNAIHQA